MLRFSSDEKTSQQVGFFLTSHRAFFPPPRLIAIFHPKWPSAFPPPTLISVSPYWILTKSRGWGTFGSPIRMSLRTSIGMRWSPNGGDFIKPLPSSNEFSSTRRYTILLASPHRRRRSCAPPHRDGTSSDGRRLYFGQRRAARAIRFRGKCCYSLTNDSSSFVSLHVYITHIFCFFYPPSFSNVAATGTERRH